MSTTSGTEADLDPHYSSLSQMPALCCASCFKAVRGTEDLGYNKKSIWDGC